VTIWPDHDESCKKAAVKLKGIITQLNENNGREANVSIVKLPQELPEKWDLADQVPEGWTFETIRQMIKEAAPFKQASTSQDKDIGKQKHKHS